MKCFFCLFVELGKVEDINIRLTKYLCFLYESCFHFLLIYLQRTVYSVHKCSAMGIIFKTCLNCLQQHEIELH